MQDTTRLARHINEVLARCSTFHGARVDREWLVQLKAMVDDLAQAYEAQTLDVARMDDELAVTKAMRRNRP